MSKHWLDEPIDNPPVYLRVRKSKPISEIDSLLALLDRTDEWTATPYHVIHAGTGIHIWTANGASFCDVERPFKVELGFIRKFRLYRATKRLRRAILHNLVTTPDNAQNGESK